MTHDFALLIDHTNLSPQASITQITDLCQQAHTYGFKSVCVPPSYVSLATKLLENSETLVCTVIGFPLGYATSEVKAFETTNALDNGADEIDMVINNCLLKDGLLEQLTSDISAVVKAAKGKTVKAILETCLLDDDSIVKACQCAAAAGAHFVKTSTGFSTSGASPEVVRLMKETVKSELEVKASGGIKNSDHAKIMVEAGASRLGTSSSMEIVRAKGSSGSHSGSY